MNFLHFLTTTCFNLIFKCQSFCLSAGQNSANEDKPKFYKDVGSLVTLCRVADTAGVLTIIMS